LSRSPFYRSGRIVGTTAAKTFKHCSLELGGKNPMIVLDDANLDLAIEGGLWGGFGTTGQRCTATSRIIIQKGIYGEFVERYVNRAKALKVGNGLDEAIDMGPAINASQLGTDLNYVEVGRSEGAKLKCGGNKLTKASTPTATYGTDGIHRCRSKMRIAQEEIFGPVVSIIPCDNLENAIEIANNIEYGLSSALYTKDVNKAFAAMRDLHAGNYLYQCSNHWRRSAPPLRRREGHRQWPPRRRYRRIDFYSEWKSVYVDYSDTLQRAQIDRPGRHFLKSTIRGLRETSLRVGKRRSGHSWARHELKSCGKTCESRFLTAKRLGMTKYGV